MSIDMSKEWLKSANDDVTLISQIYSNETITHLVAFHSQQTVEKSLKAYLEYCNRKVPKIHKLQTLLN